MGFRQGQRSPGRLKKRLYSPFHLFRKQKDLLLRGSPQPPHFKCLAASAPPPPPLLPSQHLGNVFAFPIPLACVRLYPVHIICTLFVYLCSYLSSGAVRHVSSLPYLILCTKVLLFPTVFLFGTNLWYPIYFSPTTVGTFIHVPSFQKQLWVCINITLTMA